MDSTLCFLFTDIEGSTKRWERWPEAMGAALRRHDELVRAAIEGNGGSVFKTGGDAFYAAFANPLDAIASAVAIQSAIGAEFWADPIGGLRVRVAIHVGIVEARDGDYFGQPLNRVARLLSAGHGGQVLVTGAVQELVRDRLPAELELRDLGEHRLKDLTRPERVYQLAAPGLELAFPPLRTMDAHPNNLPRQAAPLIGREREVAAVCALLRRTDVPLVTLTGPGGTGKTRLALQAAAELLGPGADDGDRGFPDGAWLVELAPIVDPALVIPTVANALGVGEVAGVPIEATLEESLREKRLLLVVDNLEQVLPAAPLLAGLLATCRGVAILATSRAPLRLRGEREYPVPPLSTPDRRSTATPERLSEYDSVRLFIERAMEIKPDFTVTNENAPAVAEICVRLDGLPLALELAAARVRLFTPQALLGRLGNRLGMLTGGGRDLPERQRTLRGAIEWSYDLLPDEVKLLFRRMAVFQGGRTIEAIEAVCAADGWPGVLDGVECLVENSLLKRRDGVDGEPRFWLLETIHDFAREKLAGSDEEAELKRAHARYFMELAETALARSAGAGQDRWMARLEEQHDNLRAALEWAELRGASGDAGAVETGLRTAGPLWKFWYIRGFYREGRERLETALATPAAETASPGARALALHGLGTLAYAQGDFAAARLACADALSIRRSLGDSEGMANTLKMLGNITSDMGERESAKAFYGEGLEIARAAGDDRATSQLLNNRANIHVAEGDPDAALPMFEEALAISRRLGADSNMSICLINIANILIERGEPASALGILDEAIGYARGGGYRFGEATCLAYMGQSRFRTGDYPLARRCIEESIAISREIGSIPSLAGTLEQLAAVQSMEGDRDEAMKSVDAAFRLLGDHRTPLLYTVARTSGHLAFRNGDLKAANAAYARCLTEGKDLGRAADLALSVAGMGAIAGERGDYLLGARLLGYADAAMASIRYTPDPLGGAVIDGGIAAARAALTPDGYEKARADGAAMGPEKATALALCVQA